MLCAQWFFLLFHGDLAVSDDVKTFAGLLQALALKVEHALGAGCLGFGAVDGSSGVGNEHPYVVKFSVAIVAAVEEVEALQNGARSSLGHVVHTLSHGGACAQALDGVADSALLAVNLQLIAVPESISQFGGVGIIVVDDD